MDIETTRLTRPRWPSQSKLKWRDSKTVLDSLKLKPETKGLFCLKVKHEAEDFCVKL